MQDELHDCCGYSGWLLVDNHHSIEASRRRRQMVDRHMMTAMGLENSISGATNDDQRYGWTWWPRQAQPQHGLRCIRHSGRLPMLTAARVGRGATNRDVMRVIQCISSFADATACQCAPSKCRRRCKPFRAVSRRKDNQAVALDCNQSNNS